MTEQQPNENEAVEAPESDAPEIAAESGTETPEEAQNATESVETSEELDAARLRGDNLYELLLERSLEQGTAGILSDPSALPRDADLYDDNGLPDVDKIRAAATTLADAKPQLAPVRGDVGQGVRETRTEETWSSLFRNAFN